MVSMFRRRSSCRGLSLLSVCVTATAIIPLAVAFDNSAIEHRLISRAIHPQCGFIGANLANRPQSTILKYKNLSEDETTTSSSSVVKPKRTKRTKPSKRSSRKRFIQAPKQLSTEAELAHHVQTVYSGEDFDELLVGGVDEEQVCNDVTKRLQRHPALVLNADYQPLRMLPLSIWSWQNAVKAVLGGKAVVVETYPDVVIRAVSIDMPVPSVIALREYAPSGKLKPAFTRRNVFLRDGYRCQYCSGLFRTADLSLDHVEPRCFGGKLTWENTVTSCKRCNGRKGCLRPSQIHTVGMTLRTKPRCPSLYELAVSANKFVPRKVHPTWAPFLGIDMDNGDILDPPTSENGSSLPRP